MTDFASADLDDIVKQLTLDERISLLAGADWWTTVPIPRLGIPAVKCTDGPNGVRGKSHFKPTPSTCIPSATCLGASFDVDLMYETGTLLAEESKAKGATMLLAPTVNIQRNPLNGRAFESFSEDPFLSGIIASSYIRGLQDNGVGACIKHFVGNDMEHQRFSVDVNIPERALREIYLKPFMIAQRLAKPWAFMTSYSRLNGFHASESPRLLQDILRGEWAFDGMIMSDWTGTYSTTEALQAGLDLEMPGPAVWRGSRVKAAVFAGKLKEKVVNDRARAVLGWVQRSLRESPETVQAVPEAERVVETAESRALNRRIASNGIVLLKNDQKALPLASPKTIAVIGPNVQTRTVSGGGSAYLTSSYVVTPWDGIREAAEKRGINVRYAPGCYGHRYLPMLDGWMKTADGRAGWTARFYNEDPRNGGALVGEVVLRGSRLRINDEKPAGLGTDFYVQIETYVTAPSTETYEFGISMAGGVGTVSVEGKVLVDNGISEKQTPGASFYGLGTVEETGSVDLVEGKTYRVDVFYKTGSNMAEADGAGQPALMMAALRVGCAAKIDSDKAIDEALRLAQASDAVVAVIGTNMDIEAEASDRLDLKLPGRTDEFVSRLLQVRPDAVIVNQSGSAVTMPWISRANTVLQSWFGGNETGNAIADVLFGDINPSGRMPLSFPHKIEHCTGHLNWQAESGKVLYGEGIFVGYRGYEETDRETMFAFGEGLSYTTFEWSPVQAKLAQPTTAADLKVEVELGVTNTGSKAGADVVQIYVSDPHCTYRRPKQELGGFAKIFLQPGETKTAKITLDKLALSFYNDERACWVAEQGTFIIAAGRSSRANDRLSSTEVTLDSTVTWTGL